MKRQAHRNWGANNSYGLYHFHPTLAPYLCLEQLGIARVMYAARTMPWMRCFGLVG
jgi:hypothetical protein